jgi:hypothetical protein
MALVAASRIEYKSEDGSQSVVFNEGDKVPASAFDKEVVEHLKELGSVVEPDTAASLDPDERDARIQELEAQLAELTGGGASGAASSPEQPVSNPAGTKKPSSAEASKATGQASGKTS